MAAQLGALEQGAIRLALAAYTVAQTDATRDVLLSADALVRRDLPAARGRPTRFAKVDGGRFFVRTADGAEGAAVPPVRPAPSCGTCGPAGRSRTWRCPAARCG
ncbi:hypothetical protein BBK82_24825 [Lentzea guizhouensis]|uniref:Uncharacterized protein n=1 Tax=Lentzea guizhouensis TaxID=1586287 RepID=A0A1B2HM46_9PSEU|nr:hypothetical protein [Lentzea guizhouensis]ANZ38807.1 hypothetical protein BBK82_24825 [Lentzea guizhouensis]